MSHQSSAAAIRVLVVDDQKMMRTILKDYVDSADDIEVVGLACNGKEGVEQALSLKPDVILMDIEMPEMDGLNATQQLKRNNSTAKVLVVSTSYEDRYLAQALRNGAMGYLLKTTSAADLVAAIRGVYEGNLQFGRDVLQRELWSSTSDAKKLPKRVESAMTSGNGNGSTTSRASNGNGISNGNGVSNGNGHNGSGQLVLEGEQRQTTLAAAAGASSASATSTAATSQPQLPNSVNLASELMQVRSGYWVLKTEMQMLRRWLGSMMIGVGVCICLTFIALFY
ncbi:MAG: response regulator transcription factor [Cyanobacteria bacterium P01_A01_bin.3]